MDGNSSIVSVACVQIVKVILCSELIRTTIIMVCVCVRFFSFNAIVADFPRFKPLNNYHKVNVVGNAFTRCMQEGKSLSTIISSFFVSVYMCAGDNSGCCGHWL